MGEKSSIGPRRRPVNGLNGPTGKESQAPSAWAIAGGPSNLTLRGVGCVTLSYGGWDTHSSNFKTLRNQLPVLDRGIANLIQDFHDRGMEDDVITVVWGEFGRTPKINGSDAGRDHWSPVMSAMVAGGGMKMGQAIGSSSARGEYPKDRHYTVPQLLSTLYQAIGVDPSAT